MNGVIQTGLRWYGEASCVWLKRGWWICLLLLAAATASALEVQDVRWGFDGQVVPGRFNLLSVLVANPAPDPFDGTVHFYKSRGMEERVGALYGTPCYLSPMTTRWLQFHVFIENEYDQWRLEWGRAPDDHHDLQPPKWGPPAQVLLTEPDTPLSTVSAFKQFPEDLFPPTVAATGGLDSLLLDHAPHWEAAKRQAFLNWLRAGGKVHLLKGADGHYPVFADELGELNSPLERLNVGSGLVVRHAATARDIHLQDVREGDAPLREYKQGQPAALNQTADSFIRVLAGLSQRRYSWGGIYLLAIVYMVLVGPANLRAGRKLADYRLRIALLLGTIAAFTLLFDLMGRRGQGEANVVHSLSYARAIEEDTYDVMQWVNVFAARGSHYTITHAAPDNLYATGQDYEAVNGWITDGKDGRLVVDIPMYSRRAFLHEAEMKGARIPVKIASWEGQARLKRLALTIGPDFTKQILEGWVVQGDGIYAMKITKGGLEFDDSYRESLAGFVATVHPQQFQFGYQPPRANTDIDVEGEFRKLAKPLLAWSLGDRDFTQWDASSAAASGRAQLFLFARSPQSFCITGSELGHEVGYVLYQLDLIKPGAGGDHD
jgi:hypothetical protein